MYRELSGGGGEVGAWFYFVLELPHPPHPTRMDAVNSRTSGNHERSRSLHHEHSGVKKAKTYGHGLEQTNIYLHVIIAELVHQAPDVRVKALRTLQSILASGTDTEWDPQSDTMPLLRNLLEWFNLPSPSAADEVLTLSILTRLAQDDLLRKMLVDLGAVEFMKHYERDVSQAILPFITSLVYTLRGRIDDTAFDKPNSRYVSGKEPDLWSISNTKQVGRDRFVGEKPLKNREYSLVVDLESERERVKEKKYSSQVRDECMRSGETSSSSPLENNDYLSCPSHQSVSSREGLGHSAGYFRRSPFKQIPRTDSLSDVSNSDALKLIMPCIALEEIDNKYLFNINVTLQHLDNPQVLLSAFKELREAIVFDFHSEALLQRFSVVQNTFEVLSKVKDHNVEHVAFEFLLELVRQIKGSLKISTEPAFQVYPENHPPLQAKQVNVPAAKMTSQADFNDSYPIRLKPGASNESENVPRSNTFLSGHGANNESGEQPVFTLSHSLHRFVLQLLPLLLNVHHRDVSLNILYELLPLLKPSDGKNLPDKVQVHFTQYFHVLCEVLQTLGGNTEDLQALCVEQTRKRNFDSRARHCLPVLSVLTFSAELLLLLQPSHVAGLLPSYLVKALAISTGDLIFAECTFGTHKHILPYLRYLDPEFYQSYTCAKEASGTLQMLRKRLALSEEALTQYKGRTKSPDIDVESLLTCMVEAAPHNSYHNDEDLVRRQARIVSDVLRIELVNAWKQRTNSSSGIGLSDENNGRPLNVSSSHSVLDKARILIFLLISSTSISVRKAAYESVLEVLDRDRWLASGRSNAVYKGELMQREECIVDHEIVSVDDSGCLLHWRGGHAIPLCVFQRFILYSPCVLGEIITAGLHDGATCKQSAELLLHLVEDLSEVERSELIDLRPWIECGGSLSPDLGALVSQISEILLSAQLLLETRPSKVCVESIELFSILRSLFSSCISQRWRASSELLKVLNSWSKSERFAPRWLESLPAFASPGSRASQRSEILLSEDASKDPFQHCFLRQEGLIVSTSCNQEPRKRVRPKISPSGQKKIEDLLSIFKSRSVGEIIRKSAVEHLIWLIQDPSLCCLLESDEELFKALIFEITNSVTKDGVDDEGIMNPAIMKSNFDDEGLDKYVHPSLTDLGTACLSFLTKLASASTLEGDLKVRDLLLSNSCEHLWSLLPLVYHPSESARKDMALLLSFCLFSSDMLLTGLKRMGIINDQSLPETCYQSVPKVTQIFVPTPFARAYCFPCQVVAVQIKALIANSSENLVEGGLVRRFIAQSDLLEGGPENLLLQLERKVGSSGESLKVIELQAFSCLSVLHAEISIKRVLKLLADPQLSYGVEVQFLQELEVQCFRHPQAAKTLAQNSWVQSFQRFLTRFPSTAEEFTQLLKVIQLIQVIIRSTCADSSGFIAVTTLIKQILLPLLAKGPNMHQAIVLDEGYPAVDLEVLILRLVVDTLLYAMEHADQELFCQVAVGLAKGTSLLSVLLSKFVKSSNAPYICCVLAVRSFTLVAKGMASFVGENDFKSVRNQGNNSHKSEGISNQEIMEAGGGNLQSKRVNVQPGSEHLGTRKQLQRSAVNQDLVQIIVPLIKHMAHLHSHHYRSLRHKGLVREIVSCLWSVTSFVLPCLWEDLWSSTGITYWLARLLEDQEAILRGMAFGILALLASPATPRTRELLMRNWPELGDVAVRSVLNEQECYAVREQGLSFLISATMWTSNERFSITMDENCPPASFKIIDGLGINAALQRYEFWNRLPSLLSTRNGTPGFHRVLVELILRLATSDVEFIKVKILEFPTFFRALVQHLDFKVMQPSGSGAHREGTFLSCKHYADIFAVKSSLGEILLVLAQDEDARLQAMIQSDLTIRKIFCALNYCLNDRKISSLIVQDTCSFIGNKVGTAEDLELYQGDDSFEKVDRIADYERAEAIFQLSEVLNLVIGKVMHNAVPFQNEGINHIRVDDIRALNTLESEEFKEVKITGVLSEEIWRNYLGLLGSQYGVFLGIARLLKRLPVLTDLHDGTERAQRQDNVDLKPSALLRRIQLGVCSLVGTVLSEERQAKAVLENCASIQYEVDSKREPYGHLAENLYDVLLRLLEEAHEQVQEPKVSQEGDFIMYLQSLLMSVGRAFQNLISFSAKAKDLGTVSDLPTKLMRFAYEVYSFLDSYGLLPTRLDNASTPTSRSASHHISKQSNKVPKMINQSNRSSPFRYGDNTFVTPKQGKLNEHHRDLLLGELILHVRLMKNYVYRSEKAAAACIEEGVFEFTWTLWAFALCEEDLMHELLGLLSNLAAQSNTAKELIAVETRRGKKGGSLMDHVTNMLCHLPLDQISYTTSIGLLQNLVMLAEPRAILLRKQYFSDFLELFRNYVRTMDVMRQHLMLQLFINISAYPNGQKMFLKGLPDGSMLDLVLDCVEQSHYIPACSAALFLLRNLAFCRETRFFFLCNERTLSLLVKSLESSSLEARAYASSALWILTSSERRISAALNKVNACSAILKAHEVSKSHLKMFESFSTRRIESNHKPETVLKMGVLVRNIEQSLFAVNQLVGGTWEFDSASATT